jgi:hypothetical protein
VRIVVVSGTDYEFDAATAVEPLGEGVFAGTVDAGWTVGDKPNGGYLLGLIARACGEALAVVDGGHADPLAATAHYLRAPDIGPVEVRTVVLRTGRGASQVRAELWQEGRVWVDATFTLGTLATDPPAPYWTARELIDVAPYEHCTRLAAARKGSPFVVPIMDRTDLRLDPAVLGFARGEPSGDANIRGWISFADGRPADPLGLLFFCDALPPATFELVQSGWVPTLSLTVYVRARPAAGPLRVSQSAHSIDDGRVDETCEVWDSSGRLVAQATQLAGIRITA